MALYTGDEAERVRQQMRAAVKDAEVLADALHTILCLGAERFDESERTNCMEVGFASFWPLEAVHLYYPQSHFFSAPYWGHAHHGVTLNGGKKAIPLQLKVLKSDALAVKTFAEGISTGMGKGLSFHLPKGVFDKFNVVAGLQVGIGEKGRVEFSVLGDGKLLVSKVVSGKEPAVDLECNVSGTAILQLKAESRGLDAKSNYAVWAEPTLVKVSQ